jgi:hypothetical protein
MRPALAPAAPLRRCALTMRSTSYGTSPPSASNTGFKRPSSLPRIACSTRACSAGATHGAMLAGRSSAIHSHR